MQEQANDNIRERQQESEASQLVGHAKTTEQEAASKDKENVTLFPTLIVKWREQEATVNVRSRQVVLDFTDLAETGLGVESLHFAAFSMRDTGFQKRLGTKGHDIPVVVEQPPEGFVESLGNTCERSGGLPSCAG